MLQTAQKQMLCSMKTRLTGANTTTINRNGFITMRTLSRVSLFADWRPEGTAVMTVLPYDLFQGCSLTVCVL